MTELIEWINQGNAFIGTPQQLVDELTYAGYKANRAAAPQIPPHRWEPVFGPTTPQMERRYQEELYGQHHPDS